MTQPTPAGGYTTHGHPYGLVDTDAPRPSVVRCGGPSRCSRCADEAGQVEVTTAPEPNPAVVGPASERQPTLPPGYVKGDDGITRAEAEHLAMTAGGPEDSPDSIASWLGRQLPRDPAQLTAAQQIRLALAEAAITAMGLHGSAPKHLAPVAAWVETGEVDGA